MTRARAREVAALVLVGIVVLWPILPLSGGLVGDPLGETDNHLWMFWRALRGERPLANLPDGVPLVLMDPVNLPAYAVGAVAGPAAGWAAMRVANAALAIVGGTLLARCFVDGPAAAIGGVALVSAPFLAGVMDFGITESWPIGWLALHAALLIRHAREGGWGTALGAGLALGAVALSGWYHALFGLLLEAMLVPALVWRHRRVGTVLQGLLGAAMAAPALAAYLGSGATALVGRRWAMPAMLRPGDRPDWADTPWFGTDILNLVLPRLDAVHPSKAVYLGLVGLALALVGLVRRPRVVGPLLLAALPFLVLSVGYYPTFAGHFLGLKGPAAFLVEAAPPLMGLSHWHRALAGALPFLATATAIGAGSLSRNPRWIALLGGLVLLDHLALGPTAWPRTTTAPDLPPVLAALPEGGGVMQIPFDNQRREAEATPARTYQRWQTLHGHPITENYETHDAILGRNGLAAALDGLCQPRGGPPRPDDPDAARADLVALGVRFVVFHADRCPRGPQAREAATRLLGPGETVGDDRWWDLVEGAR